MHRNRLVTANDGSCRAGFAPNRCLAPAALCFAVLAASAATILADPLNSPPVGDESHGHFFQSLNLLDEATLAIPSRPLATAENLPAIPHDAVSRESPSGPIAESWVWQLGDAAWPIPVQGPPPVRPETPASGWPLLLAKATPIALAAVALMALGLLFSLIPRR